jgi:hypothetical protein
MPSMAKPNIRPDISLFRRDQEAHKSFPEKQPFFHAGKSGFLMIQAFFRFAVLKFTQLFGAVMAVRRTPGEGTSKTGRFYLY